VENFSKEVCWLEAVFSGEGFGVCLVLFLFGFFSPSTGITYHISSGDVTGYNTSLQILSLIN